MELDLFQFIDEAIRMYDLHHTSFIYAERILKNHFSSLPGIPEGNVVAVFSRVKSRESLREKLLRNKFYLSADTPENAVSSLSDLVGITIECRFIRNEAETPGSRFAPGLPSTSDGSLLFLLHMIHKMDPSGARIGIVLNGSPLFNGGAGSGWSDIRRYILDQNLLDTIVALPGEIFYGTGISSYLWILDNKRPEERRNKVLFINAVHDIFSRPMQRSLGNKRIEMSDNGIEDILSIYKKYRNAYRIINTETAEEVEVAKVLDYDDFRYTQVTVQRPLRLFYNDVCNLIVRWKSENAISKGDKTLYDAILENYDDSVQRNDDEFMKEAQTILKRKNLPQSTINKLRKLAVTDENAPIAYLIPGDKDSGAAPDPLLKDTESIPFKCDIDKYFKEEVLKFVPDAWLDRTQDKLGIEFPFTRLFYKYKPMRTTEEILKDILIIDKETDQDVLKLMNEEV